MDHGQSGNTYSCGTDDLDASILQTDSGAANLREQMELIIYQITGNAGSQKSGNATLTVPVVVHIVHNNGPENIPDAQVSAGLQYLNEAFDNTGVFDSLTGVCTGIQFCLARQDEAGDTTSGINRIVSVWTDIDILQDQFLKGLIQWDPTRYLNIYVVNSITHFGWPGVAGYGSLAYLHGTSRD